MTMLSAEVLFLDDKHTGTPTDLASYSTTKRCLRGDDGRLCSSCSVSNALISTLI